MPNGVNIVYLDSVYLFAGCPCKRAPRCGLHVCKQRAQFPQRFAFAYLSHKSALIVT